MGVIPFFFFFFFFFFFHYIPGTLIAEQLPKLHAKLEENYVELAPIVLKWFLCLYVNTLPLAATLRVWDCFFHEGTLVNR